MAKRFPVAEVFAFPIAASKGFLAFVSLNLLFLLLLFAFSALRANIFPLHSSVDS